MTRSQENNGGVMSQSTLKACACAQPNPNGGPHPECPDDAWACVACGGAIFSAEAAEEIADHFAEATAEAGAS